MILCSVLLMLLSCQKLKQLLIYDNDSLVHQTSNVGNSSRWRYSSGWALASSTICLQASRFLALSLHSFTPIFLRSMDTSSGHLIFGLPLLLVAYSFPYNIFWDCGILHSFYMTKPPYSLALT